MSFFSVVFGFGFVAQVFFAPQVILKHRTKTDITQNAFNAFMVEQRTQIIYIFTNMLLDTMIY